MHCLCIKKKWIDNLEFNNLLKWDMKGKTIKFGGHPQVCRAVCGGVEGNLHIKSDRDVGVAQA